MATRATGTLPARPASTPTVPPASAPPTKGPAPVARVERPASTPAPTSRPAPAPTPPKAPPPASRFRRVLTYWFPATARPRRTDGLQSGPGPDLAAFVVATAIALAIAALWEWFSLTAPVVPGGDPSQWLLLSYPYAGLTSAPQIGILSYPPLSFPVLGFCVALMQDPLNGARLFVGATIVLLGLSMYHLGRSMFRMRAVALLVEAGFLLQPDFQQLYYFGSYPNMFGFIFFFLGVSFGIRFIRSRESIHLALFWGCVTAAILSHALVAVLLVGLIFAAGALLLLYRRLPRELVTTAAGLVGVTVCVVSGFMYYEGSILLGANPPNYLTTSVLTTTKNQLYLQATFRPLYLENAAKVFRGSGFPLDYSVALKLLQEAVIAILGVFVIARVLVPRYVSVRVTFLAAWFLSVFGVALVTWYLGLTSDYRRFAYFLYPAVALFFGIGADLTLPWLANVVTRRARPKGPINPAAPPVMPPWRWRRWDRGQVLVTGIVAVGVLVLLLAANEYTLPTAESYAVNFTGVGHDAAFVAAMGSISNSGIPGAILSLVPSVDRWPATLTSRDLYESRSPTGFTYSTDNLVQDELAKLTGSYRYTVTNGLVYGGVPGVSQLYFNASPTYGLYTLGIPHPVLKVDPTTILVTTLNGTPQALWTRGVSAIPTITSPADPTNASMVLWYSSTLFNVTETITAPPGTDSLSIQFAARAQDGTPVTGLQFRLNSATTSLSYANATKTGGFSWFTNTTNGNFTSNGTPLPGTVVTAPVYGANGSKPPVVYLNATAAGGAPELMAGITVETPGASNTARGLSGFYSSPAILNGWDVRFALFYNLSSASGATEIAYFENEFGAQPYFIDDPYTILLVPDPVAP